MLKLINKQIIRQFTIFGTIGLFNAFLDFSIYIFLTRNFLFWGKYFLITNVISFFIANISSYFLNAKFSFKGFDNSKSFIKRYIKFLTVTIFSLMIVEICLIVSVKIFHISDIYGKITGIIIGALWNFIMYKITIFKEKQ